MPEGGSTKRSAIQYANLKILGINYVDSIKEKVDNKIANEIFEESLQQELKFWDSAWDQE